MISLENKNKLLESRNGLFYKYFNLQKMQNFIKEKYLKSVSGTKIAFCFKHFIMCWCTFFFNVDSQSCLLSGKPAGRFVSALHACDSKLLLFNLCELFAIFRAHPYSRFYHKLQHFVFQINCFSFYFLFLDWIDSRRYFSKNFHTFLLFFAPIVCNAKQRFCRTKQQRNETTVTISTVDLVGYNL